MSWLKGKEIGFFDADGTIFDTLPDYGRIFSWIAKKHCGIDEKKALQFFNQTIGLYLPEQFELLLTQDGQEVSADEISRLRWHFNRKVAVAGAAKCFPEVPEVVARLTQTGHRLVLTSCALESQLFRRLQDHHLLKYFCLVIGSDKIPKQDARHIFYAAESLGLAKEKLPQKSFYVGDTCSDMAQARMAGLLAIGVSRSVAEQELRAAGADLVIPDLRPLLRTDFSA